MEKVIYSWAIQHGLQRLNTGRLQTLWLETPGYCNLACAYCFSCGGEKLNQQELIDYEAVEHVLIQAKKMGIDSLGIPGAGEPLLPINRELTMRLLRKCAELEIFVALFTTGEFITKELAKSLSELPVEILVKCNALDPDLQDRFVSDPSRGRTICGYGAKRNLALQILIDQGFADRVECRRLFGRKSRLALVSPIMTHEDGELTNLEQIADVLRYCRRYNIIFDCDSVLKRGRGTTCRLHAMDSVYRSTLVELQRIDREEFGNVWPLTQSYVGGPACDRYHHHLYITQYGEIHPCIGAINVRLGNIRKTSLKEAWDSTLMMVIRDRAYGGKCGKGCVNFAEGKCNSCLGRRTVNLNNQFLQKHGFVETIGCWNFKKK